jgi:tripartite-type tricarboxylate transporter receptor subunit TctC
MLTAWRAAILAALALLLPGEALAQAVCPETVIRIVVPFPPGGPTDVAARVIADKLKDRVGQNVIVESKAGAGGATGTGYGRSNRETAAPCCSPSTPMRSIRCCCSCRSTRSPRSSRW